MTHYKQQHSGFTLVETLVAITILLVIVTGPMTISMSTARSTTFASEQVVAFFLAQEGVEIAQKARDELFLDKMDDGSPDNPWTLFTNTSGTFVNCFKPTGCGLELNTDSPASLKTIEDCSASNRCRLYLDTTAHKRAHYTYNDDSGGNEETVYTRVVTFSNVSASDVKVVSTVKWRTGFLKQEQAVRIETHLFKVYE